MVCHKPSMLNYQVFLRKKTIMGNLLPNVRPLLTLYLKGFSESIIQIESQQFILNLYNLSLNHGFYIVVNKKLQFPPPNAVTQ